MIMKTLSEAIIDAVYDEQFRASEIHGAINSSDHESKAIIEERRDYTLKEESEFDYWFANFWALVKRDKYDELEIVKDKKRCLTEMLNRAEQSAGRWIQVAAMVRKASETLLNRTDEDE